MKRAWKRFSLLASLSFFFLPAAHATATVAKRANELSLAGLRPGKDTLTVAQKLYGAKFLLASDDEGVLTWEDVCRGQTLRVEADSSGLIQFITVEAKTGRHDCSKSDSSRMRPAHWATGHGIRLGDPRSYVLRLYGQPNSSGPSTGDHEALELLYYAFDWAGSDVPQVMEIYCDKTTGRVVEITLSNPSL